MGDKERERLHVQWKRDLKLKLRWRKGRRNKVIRKIPKER